MDLLHMREAPYRAVELSSGGGLMGSRGRASVSGGGGMPGRGGGTETETETGPPSAGASLRPHGAGSRWRGWMRGSWGCGREGGGTNTTCCQVTRGYLQPKHILISAVRHKINI